MRPEELAARLRLIVITDEKLAVVHGTGEVSGVEAVVAEALEAGCRAVQLRMKGSGARETLAAALPLRKMTNEAGALLFVNDRLDVALAAGADGVHLGPDDIPVSAARDAVQRAAHHNPQGDAPFLIGYSTDDPEEARQAVTDGADYIGCGAVYATASKDDAGEVIGLEGLDAVARAVEVPVVAIGGITPERAVEVAGTQACGVAVISAVMGAEDPAAVVTRLVAPFQSLQNPT